MGKKTTFIVSGWIERHYLLEIEASSYEEAERKGYDILNDTISCTPWGPPPSCWDEDGTQIVVGDVECEDSEWEEGDDDSSEEEKEEDK